MRLIFFFFSYFFSFPYLQNIGGVTEHSSPSYFKAWCSHNAASAAINEKISKVYEIEVKDAAVSVEINTLAYTQVVINTKFNVTVSFI